MESDDGGAENELHVKIIGFVVKLWQKERKSSRDEIPRAPEAATEETVDNDTNSSSGYEIEKSFEGGSSKAMKEFRAMILCDHLEKDIFLAQNIMEHLKLKGIEKGSTNKE